MHLCRNVIKHSSVANSILNAVLTLFVEEGGQQFEHKVTCNQLLWYIAFH